MPLKIMANRNVMPTQFSSRGIGRQGDAIKVAATKVRTVGGKALAGAAGAVVSIVQVPKLVGALWLPAASVAVTLSGCKPSAITEVVTE